ncbi:MAG TPA: pantoate--beta-alanine ligase [Gemmatimonadaceae bacterium]|nr:pantoate--beta-alanine ligase [Gemmatimonadaceae bacterium]
MQTLDRISALRAALAEPRRRGVPIALVPTMGYLHEGHLRLVDEARRHAGVVVMSIFVNPLQFGPHEDFARYPRDPEGDAAKAERRGVDILFAPPVEEIYPSGERTVVVTPLALADRWEGAARPGHFTGVLTVVAKLFNIVQPQVAVFGQKDIQQATLIRAMTRELDFPVKLIIAPTQREPDGLALSSRNSYLSPDHRRRALVLSRTLRSIAAAFDAGQYDAVVLEQLGWETLATEPEVHVDYLAIVDPDRLEPVAVAEQGTIVAIAARVGSTRLIDNVILGAS